VHFTSPWSPPLRCPPDLSPTLPHPPSTAYRPTSHTTTSPPHPSNLVSEPRSSPQSPCIILSSFSFLVSTPSFLALSLIHYSKDNRPPPLPDPVLCSLKARPPPPSSSLDVVIALAFPGAGGSPKDPVLQTLRSFDFPTPFLMHSFHCFSARSFLDPGFFFRLLLTLC